MLGRVLPSARMLTHQLGHHTFLASVQTLHCWHKLSRRTLAHYPPRDANHATPRPRAEGAGQVYAAKAPPAAQDILPSHLQHQQRSPGAPPDAPSEQAGTSESISSRRTRRGGFLSRRAPPEESTGWQGPAAEQCAGSSESIHRQQSGSACESSATSRTAAGDEPALGASNATITIRDQLTASGIILRRYHPGQQNSLICPKCKGGGSSEASFSVHISDDSREARWICHRGTCGWAGGCSVETEVTSTSGRAMSSTVMAGRSGAMRGRKAEAPVKPNCSRLLPLSAELLEYFAARGISQRTLARNGVLQDAAGVIAFPYRRDGQVVNLKFRTLDKRFWQVKGAEKVLYGLDDVKTAGEIIIVEGEMDKLALEEAGMTNVLSVPDGAPREVKAGDVPPPDADPKFAYLWNCRAVLDQAVRIVLATDSDAPGQALAEELARRLGRDRCWRVRWPNASDPDQQQSADSSSRQADSGARKDANEVLLKDGSQALQDLILSAEPYPIRGLFKFSDFLDEIWSEYDRQDALGEGVNTGWSGLDSFYRVVPGELSIVTGVPNSGKSEWIDALLCNLARLHGWSFALCSMEKKVKDHARQLLEKYIGKPFLSARYAGSAPRMDESELEEGLQWLDDRFHVIRYEDDELPSIDWVLNLARAAVLRNGIRGLVIDPYNELDHQRPAHMNETEYVSQMLTKVKRFAQHNDVHVWFVAHPRQLQGWRGEPPNLYDISGSAHFINKADNGLVIHRNRDPEQGQLNHVKILVRKVRNKAAGTIGEATLDYDRASGRYKDVI